jgi:hypothetical protein
MVMEEEPLGDSMMGGEGARARDGALGGVATAPEMPELFKVSLYLALIYEDE